MSDCCSTTKDCARPASIVQPGDCPDCKLKAQSVSTLTVKSLVRDHWRVPASASFYFCRTAQCDVVYFSDQYMFRKAEVKVRVGLKEREDPIPVCYCFGYDRSDLRRDIEARGTSEIPDRIRAEIQAGFCACEVKNPSGNCCLGDVNRAVKEIEEEAVRHSR
jgi:hypothetical protein